MAARKSGFFTVALSGSTIDGRTIKPEWLTQAAKNFNPSTYQPRINLEHIRGVTATGDFKALGDVIALKTEEVTVQVSGKPEKRTALFAQIEASDALVKMKKDGQKLYSSIEIQPKFAGTEEAGLVGLAMTDSPASIGTERLTFASKLFEDKAFSEAHEADFTLTEEAAPAETAAIGAFASFMTKLTAAIAPAPKTEPVLATQTLAEQSELATQMLTGFAAIGSALKEVTDNLASFAKIQKEDRDAFTSFREKVEATPGPGSGTRQPAKGEGAHDYSRVF